MNFTNLINIANKDVLRYLEYKEQNIDDNLTKIINDCRNLTKGIINPRYILRVYPINREIHINNLGKKEYNIQIKDTNLNLQSKALYNHLDDCKECVLMAATLGIDIEKEIRKYSYLDLTKGIIIDSCATTAIEEVCDEIHLKLENKLTYDKKYLTSRYSPGYGDLAIENNIDILNILGAQNKIGLMINESGIMIPRKSVIAIIGISYTEKTKCNKTCLKCNNHNSCKYKREV